jgi:hypothetical protein
LTILQVPAVHSSLAQMFPHLPQFLASDCRSTHAAEHESLPSAHCVLALDDLPPLELLPLELLPLEVPPLELSQSELLERLPLCPALEEEPSPLELLGRPPLCPALEEEPPPLELLERSPLCPALEEEPPPPFEDAGEQAISASNRARPV